ncbi:hypothetical protein Tco_0052223 [Tanacetum coccineum]
MLVAEVGLERWKWNFEKMTKEHGRFERFSPEQKKKESFDDIPPSIEILETSSDDTPPSTNPFQTSSDDTLKSSSEDTCSFDDTWE